MFSGVDENGDVVVVHVRADFDIRQTLTLPMSKRKVIGVVVGGGGGDEEDLDLQ